MDWLGRASFEIDSPLKPAEVQARFERHVAATPTRAFTEDRDASGAFKHDPKTESDRFELTVYAWFPARSSMNVRATIRGRASGSRVHVEVGPGFLGLHLPLILGALVSLWMLFGLHAVWRRPGHLLVIMGWALFMLLFTYALAAGGYRRLVPKTCRVLSRIVGRPVHRALVRPGRRT